MGDQNPAGTPAQIDLAAITKSVTEGVLAAIKPQLEKVGQIDELVKNQKTIADTLAQLPPAKPAEKKEAVAGDAPKALDEAAVAKIVADALAADRKNQQTTAEQKAARDAFVADPANGLAKLPDAYKAQLGNDPAKWPAEAAALKGGWEKFVKDNNIPIPDVGGANREGGTTPASGGGEKAKPAMPGVDPNRYDYLKMPGEPGNPQPASAK